MWNTAKQRLVITMANFLECVRKALKIAPRNKNSSQTAGSKARKKSEKMSLPIELISNPNPLDCKGMSDSAHSAMLTTGDKRYRLATPDSTHIMQMTGSGRAKSWSLKIGRRVLYINKNTPKNVPWLIRYKTPIAQKLDLTVSSGMLNCLLMIAKIMLAKRSAI